MSVAAATAASAPQRRRARAQRVSACAPEPDTSGLYASTRSPRLLSRSRRQLLQLAPCALCCALQLPAVGSGWSYGGGAVDWSESATCSLGRAQSPLNLLLAEAAEVTGAAPLLFHYASKTVTVRDTGHGLQATYEQSDSAPTLSLGDRTLRLLQWHFHTPSEHALEGRRLEMEAHLVHSDAVSGALTVLAVLLRADSAAAAAPNPALAVVLAGASAAGPPGGVNPITLLPPPGQRGYYQYTGSLTTPPCTEAVSWVVMDTPQSVPPIQVIAFQRLVGNGGSLALNARPLQQRNGRQVTHASV